MTAKPDPEISKKRIHESHLEIDQLLSNCVSSTDPSQTLEYLKRLLALLGRHFADEEAQLSKLGQAASAQSARFENTLQGLKEEHRQLLETMRELIDRAGKSEGDDPELRESIQSLKARFAAHEARENEIFVESVWTDIGNNQA